MACGLLPICLRNWKQAAFVLRASPILRVRWYVFSFFQHKPVKASCFLHTRFNYSFPSECASCVNDFITQRTSRISSLILTSCISVSHKHDSWKARLHLPSLGMYCTKLDSFLYRYILNITDSKFEQKFKSPFFEYLTATNRVKPFF